MTVDTVVMDSVRAVSNPVTNTNSDRARRSRKKKRLLSDQRCRERKGNQTESHARWRTPDQQELYSSKLVQALSQVQLTPSSPSAPRRGRAVREAADRALAFTARGKSRWSRAILTGRIKLKFRKQQRRQRTSAAAAVTSGGGMIGSGSRSRKTRLSVLRLRGKSLPAVQRKVRVLGRLVPGCRKQPLPVVLEEATDYIAALEMQIRAMSTIAELLSGAGSSSAPTS